MSIRNKVAVGLAAVVVGTGLAVVSPSVAVAESVPIKVVNGAAGPEEDSGGGDAAYGTLTLGPDDPAGLSAPPEGVSSADIRSGVFYARRDYHYASINTRGEYNFYRLHRIDKVVWRITSDNTLLYRWADSGFILFRNEVMSCRVKAYHTHISARLYPYPTGAIAPGNKTKDLPITNCSSSGINSFTVTNFGWQNADTRWLRDVSQATIELPSDERFCGCGTPSAAGKRTHRFSTTLDVAPTEGDV